MLHPDQLPAIHDLKIIISGKYLRFDARLIDTCTYLHVCLIFPDLEKANKSKTETTYDCIIYKDSSRD